MGVPCLTLNLCRIFHRLFRHLIEIEVAHLCATLLIAWMPMAAMPTASDRPVSAKLISQAWILVSRSRQLLQLPLNLLLVRLRQAAVPRHSYQGYRDLITPLRSVVATSRRVTNRTREGFRTLRTLCWVS